MKENFGDIIILRFHEIISQERTIYNYEKKPLYSSDDEIGLIYNLEKKLFQNKTKSTLIMKKNGLIIETAKNNTLEILDYFSII